MELASFSSEIRGLTGDDPKGLSRSQSLDEIQRCLGRFLDQWAIRDWETRLAIELPDAVKHAFESRDTWSNPTMSPMFVIDLANYSIAAFVLVSALKTVDLGDALIRAANERRFIVCAMAQRALLEQAASLNYFRERIQSYEVTKVEQKALEELRDTIFQFVYGGRYDWFKMMAGAEDDLLRKSAWRRAKRLRPPQISEMIKSLDKYAIQQGLSRTEGALLMRYSELSEFAHSTYASSLLYAEIDKLGIFRLRQTEKAQLESLFDLSVVRTAAILLLIESLLLTLARIKFVTLSSRCS